MKTLAWIPCTVEYLKADRKDEYTVFVHVVVTPPGGVPKILVQPITLRDNQSTGDPELYFMAAVSHLQNEFKTPEPKPSHAQEEGTSAENGSLKSSVGLDNGR